MIFQLQPLKIYQATIQILQTGINTCAYDWTRRPLVSQCYMAACQKCVAGKTFQHVIPFQCVFAKMNKFGQFFKLIGV